MKKTTVNEKVLGKEKQHTNIPLRGGGCLKIRNLSMRRCLVPRTLIFPRERERGFLGKTYTEYTSANPWRRNIRVKIRDRQSIQERGFWEKSEHQSSLSEGSQQK